MTTPHNAAIAAALATIAATLSTLAAALTAPGPDISQGGPQVPADPEPAKRTRKAKEAPATAPAPQVGKPLVPTPVIPPAAPAPGDCPTVEAIQVKGVELVTGGIAAQAVRAAIDPAGRRAAELSPAERLSAMVRLIALAQPAAPAVTPAGEF
jgi:hypothetical protein